MYFIEHGRESYLNRAVYTFHKISLILIYLIEVITIK